ncbi:Uncharacterised protein [Mycobacteroides abscessus subsp. abscessus]|nr:Uncharacterised protein [Mycobacteroides abscessus subsp. abscessus]
MSKIQSCCVADGFRSEAIKGTAKNSTETSIETISMGMHSAASAAHGERGDMTPPLSAYCIDCLCSTQILSG